MKIPMPSSNRGSFRVSTRSAVLLVDSEYQHSYADLKENPQVWVVLMEHIRQCAEYSRRIDA
jgi:hypothetical protein